LSCNSPLPSSSSFLPQAFLRRASQDQPTQDQSLASLDSADDSRGPPPSFSEAEGGRPVKVSEGHRKSGVKIESLFLRSRKESIWPYLFRICSS
jgi:hypothetical protein